MEAQFQRQLYFSAEYETFLQSDILFFLTYIQHSVRLELIAIALDYLWLIKGSHIFDAMNCDDIAGYCISV